MFDTSVLSREEAIIQVCYCLSYSGLFAIIRATNAEIKNQHTLNWSSPVITNCWVSAADYKYIHTLGISVSSLHLLCSWWGVLLIAWTKLRLFLVQDFFLCLWTHRAQFEPQSSLPEETGGGEGVCWLRRCPTSPHRSPSWSDWHV